MIAADLHAKLDYVWWAQRRGYVRNTLNERKCDFWPGIGSNVEMVATTRPYYRSTYMFVSRAERESQGPDARRSAAEAPQDRRPDGRQRRHQHAARPCARARAGSSRNVRGYMLYGDYRSPTRRRRSSRAVERGDVDVALVWGPLAGYFAAQSPVPLRLEPVTPWFADMQWPMQFDISVGVQKDNQKLLKEIDRVLVRRRSEIHRLLAAITYQG